MRPIRVALPLLLAPLLMGAGTVPDQPDHIALTIYNSDMALVEDTRQIDVPAGHSRLEFKNVSTGIRPETVALSGKGLSVVEQNFDYDLLTPSKMMEKAVGKTIQIIRTAPGTGKETSETATVLSVNEGVILKIGDHIEVLRDDGIPTRVIFDGIPENLRAQPTLSVTVDADSAGPRQATLSYLTTGLSWTADYVAQYDEKQATLALQGWITLTNRAGTSFADVTPRLVADGAGDNGRQSPLIAHRLSAGSNDIGGGLDFPIYRLPAPVTVAENQTKQVGFLDLAGLKATKSYRYDAAGFASQETPQHASVRLAFTNSDKDLPQGTVRVYMRDVDGAAKFAGEQNIGRTPADSDLSLTMGDAFDITVQSTVVSSARADRNHTSYAMRYDIRNAQAAPATVTIRQGGLNGDVSNESSPGKRIDAFTQSWDVTVPAHGQSALTFSAVGG